MSWVSVCDAWKTVLVEVDGLSDAIFHLYAPWSPENLYTEKGERHCAIWPMAEAESAVPLLADGSQLAEQEFAVLVWEDGGEESGRLMDNDEANMEWLVLHETIRALFMDSDNIRLGNPGIMRTRYTSGAFPTARLMRVMDVRFRVSLPLQMA